jgi:hypothetical protein
MLHRVRALLRATMRVLSDCLASLRRAPHRHQEICTSTNTNAQVELLMLTR